MYSEKIRPRQEICNEAYEALNNLFVINTNYPIKNEFSTILCSILYYYKGYSKEGKDGN